MITIARPIKFIPINQDIKCLKTLLKEGYSSQAEIVEYYKKRGIEVDQSTISRRIQTLNKIKKK